MCHELVLCQEWARSSRRDKLRIEKLLGTVDGGAVDRLESAQGLKLIRLVVGARLSFAADP